MKNDLNEAAIIHFLLRWFPLSKENNDRFIEEFKDSIFSQEALELFLYLTQQTKFSKLSLEAKEIIIEYEQKRNTSNNSHAKV